MPTITIRKEVSKRELREMLYQQILDHGPEHFNQQTWATVDGHNLAVDQIASQVNLDHCGTTACVAGHAIALGAKVNLDTKLTDTAAIAEAFGLPYAAFEYLPTAWPTVMREAYSESKKVNPNEQDAQWWGALQYLISLRYQND